MNSPFHSSCHQRSGSRQAVPGRGSCRGGRRVRRLHWPCRPRRAQWPGRSPGTNSPLDCLCPDSPARLGVASPNSLRSLRSLRSNRRRRVSLRSALRAPTPSLCCSSPLKSPLPGTARRERNGIWSSEEETTTHPQRRVRAGRSAPLRRRGAEPWGRRACALRRLTRRRCLNVAHEGREVSSTARLQGEHHSGVGGTPPTAEAKRSGLPGRAFAAQTVRFAARVSYASRVTPARWRN
jgi:hypothetical protein